MLARTTAATPWGIEARPVQVEVDVHNGLPQVQIVGLADAAVRESRERVRAAIKNCGFDLDPKSIIINLAPADLRKEGNHLDLAIALAMLAAYEQIPQEALDGRLICGELGLDGAIRTVRGGLAIADLGRRLGYREVLLPAANAAEAAALEASRGRAPRPRRSGPAPDRRVGDPRRPHPPSSLPWPVVPRPRSLGGARPGDRQAGPRGGGGRRAQPPLPRASGSGKTMLARRLPGLLPPLTLAEAIAVTKVHSLVAEEPPAGLLQHRPFRSPHTGTSTAGMIGGGSNPRPGEASLAHNGVLFLDELPEFRRDTLEALRQPLEEGFVTVVRARARLAFPARFSLLAAMNPCPCGHLGDPDMSVAVLPRSSSVTGGGSRGRSGPHRPPRRGAGGQPEGAALRSRRDDGRRGARVATARASRPSASDAEAPTPNNAAMGPEQLRSSARRPGGPRPCSTPPSRSSASPPALSTASSRWPAPSPTSPAAKPSAPRHLAEAIQYRSLDRRMVL